MVQKNNMMVLIMIAVVLFILFGNGCEKQDKTTREPKTTTVEPSPEQECITNDDCNIQTEECDLDPASSTYGECILWDPLEGI